MSYLIELVVRLTTAAAQWPEDFCRRHADYLRREQRADGGFAGRQGAADLYYTSFALRALGMLGALDQTVAQAAGRFVQSQLADTLPGVELYSLVMAAEVLRTGSDVDPLDKSQRAALIAAIDSQRRPDGGYAKSVTSPVGSTYHTFLAVMCRRMLGLEIDEVEAISEFVTARRRDDGGFAEITQMKSSGTNPTAAAVMLLAELDRLDDATRNGAVQFLSSMQNGEGGFRANPSIPAADLLSTFTALTALDGMKCLTSVDPQAAVEFAKRLEQPAGGYRGGAWDDATDVEYTFYGLGTLALGGR